MKPNFSKLSGLIPAIIIDAGTREVLMVGFMNEEAFRVTEESKRVTFYSRTKKRLWVKGEESGNFLTVVAMQLDCDNDSLLIHVHPVGPVCHTGEQSCFGNSTIGVLESLEKIIRRRRLYGDESSYVKKLIESGIAKVAQKVGEEATEVVIASVQEHFSQHELVSESSDLLFHLLVLLNARGVSLHEVYAELNARAVSGER